jgi:hypothetical protein
VLCLTSGHVGKVQAVQRLAPALAYLVLMVAAAAGPASAQTADQRLPIRPVSGKLNDKIEAALKPGAATFSPLVKLFLTSCEKAASGSAGWEGALRAARFGPPELRVDPKNRRYGSLLMKNDLRPQVSPLAMPLPEMLTLPNLTAVISVEEGATAPVFSCAFVAFPPVSLVASASIRADSFSLSEFDQVGFGKAALSGDDADKGVLGKWVERGAVESTSLVVVEGLVSKELRYYVIRLDVVPEQGAPGPG